MTPSNIFHAKSRVLERCEEHGIRWEEVEAAVLKAKPPGWVGSFAVRVKQLPHMVGRAWSRGSNGDEVWAIIRSGVIQTVMLRRHTQLKGAENFNVEFVCL